MAAMLHMPSTLLHHARQPASLQRAGWLRWRRRCQQCTTCAAGGAQNADSLGRCYVVGAGPGPANLLTVRAVELLKQADVIVYDDLGAQEAVARYAPSAAERIYVGKRGQRDSIKQGSIDEILVEHALQGKTVVRLKGGCPAVFSRLHSELAALGAAGIPVEVVPGVSSALAAPLAAGFPLTHPELSRGFLVASAHDPDALDWPTLAAVDTLVLLMAGSTLGVVIQRLINCGKPTDTSVAVIRDATLPSQRTWRGEIGTIVQQTEGEKLSPCIVIVGQVAAPLPQ